MTTYDTDVLDSIEADLRDAVGKQQAITSGELSDRHLPEDGEANPTTREIIKEVMMGERGLPVVSCASGYYIPEDRATIEAELESLRGRIAGIQQRMQLLEDNWQQWRTVADGGTERREWDDLSDEEKQRVREDDILDPSDFGGGGDE